MTDKRVLITGGNAGIGLATAEALATRGARVTIACRDVESGATAVADLIGRGIGEVDVASLDLASFESIESLSSRLHRAGDPIDVLVNNAGVVTSTRTLTPHGFETMFGVNHVGHFHLTNLLLDLLYESAPSRIVVVASGAHRFARDGMDFDDLHSERHFGPMKTYARSKLANMLFTRALSNRLDHSRVTVNAVHPGAVRTRLGRDGDGGRIGEVAMRLASPFFRSPAKGARASVHVASAAALEGVSGRYFIDEEEKQPAAVARDETAAARLWECTDGLVRSVTRG